MVSTVPGWADADVDVDVVLRPHEVALTPAPDARRRARRWWRSSTTVPSCCTRSGCASGQTVRSWQPHSVRHPVGTPVSVSVVPGITPTLLVGDQRDDVAA